MGVTSPHVSVVIDSGVAVVTLCDAASGNALGPALLEGLHRALDRVEAPDVRAVLLRSSAAEFCRGLDLEAAFGDGVARSDPNPGRIEAFVDLLARLRGVSRPVVALVEGPARAGGVGLAGAADVVLAGEGATFQLTEVFLNLLPGVVAAHLTPGRIAPGVLKSLVLTGAVLDADAARRVGLVDEVLPRGRAEARTRQLLRSLLRASPGAVAATKGFWADELEGGVEGRGRAGARETARLLDDPATAAAVEALAESRLPPWALSFRPTAALTGGGSSGPEAAAPPPPGPVWVSRPAEGVLKIQLSDPVGRNALGRDTVRGLLAALREPARTPDVRVCLLTGLPDVFCSGASPDALEGIAGGRIHLDEAELAAAMLRCPVPVIAAAEGHAVGGGLVLLAAADRAVLAREARYGAVFMDLGLTPGMGCTVLLQDLMGPGLAREMMFAGGTYRGVDLERLGAGGPRVVDADAVRGEALRLAARMAEKSPEALRLLKRTLARPRLAALVRARAEEDAMHAELLAEPGISAVILERRPA